MKIHTQNVKKQYFLGVQIIWAGSTMMPPEAIASGSRFSGVVAHFHSLLALGGQVPCLEYQNVSLPLQFTAFCISLTGTWSDWEQLKKIGYSEQCASAPNDCNGESSRADIAVDCFFVYFCYAITQEYLWPGSNWWCYNHQHHSFWIRHFGDPKGNQYYLS